MLVDLALVDVRHGDSVCVISLVSGIGPLVISNLLGLVVFDDKAETLKHELGVVGDQLLDQVGDIERLETDKGVLGLCGIVFFLL